MIGPEDKDKLDKTLQSIDINFLRLEYAYSHVSGILPLTVGKYETINESAISFIDQYIFRFAKTQDLIGEKLFKITLELVQEDTYNKPFLDILNDLEKFEIISRKEDWIRLRKMRNEVSHEYPILDEESIQALNALFNSYQELHKIYLNCRNFLEKRKIL